MTEKKNEMPKELIGHPFLALFRGILKGGKRRND